MTPPGPILLLNTCGAQAIVALADSTGILAQAILPARSTSEALLPAIREVLGGLPVAQLAAIAVVAGPGSFTGVRVGLAAAKGLAESGAVPLLCLSRLHLLAASSPPATPILDGGRDEFYTLAAGAEVLLPRARIAAGPLVTSEPRVLEAFPQTLLIPEPAGAALLAASLPLLAARSFTDPALADANYIRRPDAELKLAELKLAKRKLEQRESSSI